MYHQYGSGRLFRNANNNNSCRELEEDDDEINGDPSKLSTTRSYIEMMREDKESSSETAYRDLIHSKSANKNNYRRSSFNESTTAVPASDIAFGSCRFDPSTAYPADDYVMDCNGEVCVRVPPSRQPKKEEQQEQEQEQEQEDELSRPSPVLVDDHKDDKPGNPRGMMMLTRSSSVAVSRAGEEEEAPAAKVSLMDLLMEEKGGTDGAEFFLRIFGGGDEEGGEGEEEEEEEEEEEREEDGEEHDCGVCMVRHKGGAAAAPCGHTYCRLCSRELWVSKGNCPLCNGYVTEILDIF